MISWTMIACLKLASLGLVGDCRPWEPNVGEADAVQFGTMHTPETSALVRCRTAKCDTLMSRMGEPVDENGYPKFVVVAFPHHRAYALLTNYEAQSTIGDILRALSSLDTVR